MSGSGGNRLDWIVKQSCPWWHRGAATAAMLLLVNFIIAWWQGEIWITIVSLLLAAALGMMDSTLNK